MSIRVEHLTHIYDKGLPTEQIALEDINFAVEDGELLGVIGHTGSGKSTLLQHLNGLLKPDAGRVIVGDVDITAPGVSMVEIRKRIGLVFQYPEYQLFEETVAKDVAFGPKNLGLSDSEIEERVREAIELVGLDYEEIRERSPFELSGGQKQRLATADALAGLPACLVLDEPTAMLDPDSRKEVINIVKELNRKEGMTIILITHHTDEVVDADRIVLMKDGKIIGDDIPKKIFADYELLKKAKMDIPPVVELGMRLEKQQIGLEGPVLQEQEMIEKIVKLYRSKCGGKKDAAR